MNHGILLGSVAFLIGFVSLFLETLSFTVTYLYVIENSHVAALVLSAFLCGIAVAAITIRRYITDTVHTLGYTLTLIVAAICLYTFGFYVVPDILGKLLYIIESFSQSTALRLAAIWLFLFIPGFLVGAPLPLLLEMQKRMAPSHISISTLYAVDVFGGTAGALMAGFIAVPMFGISTSLFIASLACLATLAVSTTLLPARTARRILGVAALCAVVVITHFYTSSISSNTERASNIPYDQRFGNILFQEPSPYGVVTIGEHTNNNESHTSLYINYRGMCHSRENGSVTFIAKTAAANLPPRGNVLAIGLGCGYTLNELLSYPVVQNVDVYEINPVIAEHSTQHFFSNGANPQHDPRVTLTTESGLTPLRQTGDNQYGAIVIDVEEPDVIQSSPLYTQEYFQEAQRVLTDDGIFALWAVRGGERYNKILYKTLSTVFTHVYLTETSQATGVQLFASNSDIVVEEGMQFSDAELRDIPINVLYHNALQDEYSIEEYFKLPEDFTDPYIQ